VFRVEGFEQVLFPPDQQLTEGFGNLGRGLGQVDQLIRVRAQVEEPRVGVTLLRGNDQFVMIDDHGFEVSVEAQVGFHVVDVLEEFVNNGVGDIAEVDRHGRNGKDHKYEDVFMMGYRSLHSHFLLHEKQIVLRFLEIRFYA
jgi:hypothetical protein